MIAFEQEINAIIQEIAKSEGWDIVLTKEAGVIFASDKTDKTDIIIKKLDEKEAKKVAKKTVSVDSTIKTTL
jgi:Skp family chaperone for outer membrane proteins